jgi:hypothetical protein
MIAAAAAVDAREIAAMSDKDRSGCPNVALYSSERACVAGIACWRKPICKREVLWREYWARRDHVR